MTGESPRREITEEEFQKRESFDSNNLAVRPTSTMNGGRYIQARSLLTRGSPSRLVSAFLII